MKIHKYSKNLILKELKRIYYYEYYRLAFFLKLNSYLKKILDRLICTQMINIGDQ